MTGDELRAAFQAWVDRPKGVGRPSKTLAEVEDDLQTRAAFDVEELVLKNPEKPRIRAYEQIAKEHGQSIVWVKKATQRREFAGAMVRRNAAAQELKRRAAGLPDDVRQGMRDWSVGAALKLLREAGVDGDAPDEFVEVAREFMSRK